MITLASAVAALRRRYGKPKPPISRNPFHLILWEQVAYLAPDQLRRDAFAALKADIGLAPAAIAAAPHARLVDIARMGGAIAAAERANRMRESAELVLGKWDGDLKQALRLPLPQARKSLRQFASIGEPGADRILVIAKKARLLPLDSNALRVLQRLGLAPEHRNYGTAYRLAQQRLAKQLPRSWDGLLAASDLLRSHGQELCRRSAPECGACPLAARCPSALT